MKKRSNGNRFILIILIILLIFALYAYYADGNTLNFNNEDIEEIEYINDDIEIEESNIDEKENVEKNEIEDIVKEEKVKEKKEDEVVENKVETKLNVSPYLNNVTNNTGIVIKEGWQNIITTYLDLYTESLINLESKDVSSLFTSPNGIEAYLVNTIIDFKVKHDKMQKNDMSLSEASYDIEYTNVSIEGNRIKIKFLENDYYKFKFMNNISKVFDVETTIMLRKESGKYTIDYIRTGRDHYVMFTDIIDTDKDRKSDIDKLKAKYLSWIQDEANENARLLEEVNKKDYQPKSCDHEYDRDLATTYAMKYSDRRNSNYYDYSNDGGNCANYASQVIYAGGIPMDIVGNYEWKYYGKELDTSNTKNGRSNSWTSTNYFYEYAKNNSGYGMCADTDINIFYALGGDVIQVGYDGFTHTAVVLNKIVKNDKIIDISINSNTVGLENYPLLAYTYQNKRLIKILGYND